MTPGSRVAWMLVVCLVLSTGRMAFADDDVDGWRIGLGAIGGFVVQKAEANSETSLILGPASIPPAPIPAVVQPPTNGESTQTSGLLLATLEVATPALLEDLPGSPRLFAHVDVGGNFGQEDDVARALDPARKLDLNPLLVGLSDLDPNSLLGQGSRTTLNLNPLTYSAGIGFSFEFEAFERVIRIKPSAEYFAQTMKASGIVSRAVVINTVGPKPNQVEDFRHILLQAGRTRTFHGAGVGLEIETDAVRIAPFTVSVFANGQALNILGGREISLLARNTSDPDPNAQRESARFRVQIDDWAYRAGVGIRFRWSPDR